jgi:putative cardiolipin synthase
MGVELYELNMNLDKEERRQMKQGGIGDSRASLHARSFLLDRKRVFIGSLNLDAGSIIQNTEIGVVFESEEIAKRMAEGFDEKLTGLPCAWNCEAMPRVAKRYTGTAWSMANPRYSMLIPTPACGSDSASI